MTQTPKATAFYCECGEPLVSLGVVHCKECGLVWATSVMRIASLPGVEAVAGVLDVETATATIAWVEP